MRKEANWLKSGNELKDRETAALIWLECVIVVAMLYLSATLLGCSGQTGWRVSFGVAPVTAIEDSSSLQTKTGTGK